MTYTDYSRLDNFFLGKGGKYLIVFSDEAKFNK